MSSADGKLFELLADGVCLDLLERLLAEDEPLTQQQLARRLELNSSTISRRMGQLEDAGLVRRQTAHAPYEIVFPSKTREVLLSTAELARSALESRLEDASSRVRSLRKESLAGGRLRDRARERK